MIRISQLRLPCGYAEGSLEKKIEKTLRSGKYSGRFKGYTIARHSIDARKKPQIFDTYTVDVETGLSEGEEASLLKRLRNKNVSIAPRTVYRFPSPGTESLSDRPVIIGAGPAGLFCGLLLAEHGYRPLILERGSRMEDRTEAVERFWKTGVLDPSSNVQFGEGGAGTFSDGKLNTQINDKTGKSTQVLHAFVEAGAPESILYEGKPHIGTDRLRTVIPNLRRRIEDAGGEIRFDTLVTGFALSGEGEDRRVTGVFVRDNTGTDRSADRDPEHERPDFLPAGAVILAIGHSARDTIEEIYAEKIPLQQKQFAVGLRVAHPQAIIDQSQYGCSDPDTMAAMRLDASPYKLTARAASGRGVYSFCMCPGGYIVNASSEPGCLCVNGMSDEKRDSGWANSAIVITVGEEEFGSSHVLAGMEFQRTLERRAWQMGQGLVPVQSFEEYSEGFLRECSLKEDSPEDKPLKAEIDEQAGLIRTDSPKAESEDPAEADCTLPDRLRGACRKAPLHKLLPGALTRDFIEGMEQFGHKIEGFDGPSALLAGVESRTSSPVRIPRDETFQSIGVRGLYPCGEGAGYAGGIMSAAMDGMRIAEAVAAKYQPLTTGRE